MPDYSALKHEEISLRLNAGNSLSASAVMTLGSLATCALTISSVASGDFETSVYAGVISVLAAVASVFCDKSYIKGIRRLEEARNELKGLEGKL